MQRSFAFGDLHFRSGKALTFSALLEPPGEKRFTAAVLRPYSLEYSPPLPSRSQLLIDGGLESLQTYRKGIEPAVRDRAAPQRVELFLHGAEDLQ